MPGKGRPFQKGHKFAKGSNVQIRRDLTIELISQLNEILESEHGVDRIKMQAVVSNLIDNAIEHVPIFDKEGLEVGVEKGDLTAIIHFFRPPRGQTDAACRSERRRPRRA